MCDINSMGNALTPNRRNSVPCTQHAQLRLPDKGRAIKGLVVCNNWDLEPLDLLNGLALGCYQPSPEVLIVYGVLWYLSSIAILTTTTKDQTHTPCAGLKTHPIDHDSYPHYIANNQPFDSTTFVSNS